MKILREIHQICGKYRIPYALDSGILLGAIRHGGSIPWGSNAGIMMMRNQWEVSQKAASRELCEDMRLSLPESLQGRRRFYDFMPRIIYECSRRRSLDAETVHYKEKLNHLWMDIFIPDRLPDEQADTHTLLEQKVLYALATRHRRTLSYGKHSLGQKNAIFLGNSAGRPVLMKKLFALQDKAVRRANKEQIAEWHYSDHDPGYIDIRLSDTAVQERIQIRLGDCTLCIPKHCGRVFTKICGDHMRLPPKEKRWSSHESTGIRIYG